MNPIVCLALTVPLVFGCRRSSSPRAQAPAPRDSVSVGYGTQARRDGTGAATSITPTEADTRVARVEDLLRARVPGLEVIRQPDGSYALRIRGQHSLRDPGAGDDAPLLVIDGTPITGAAVGSTLAGLAPRDIERIDVLKDAAATSIYGTRGANGVIIISTKRAR